MLILCLWLLCGLSAEATSIGVNWGRQASHPLNPDTVVSLLKDNGISKVKLFDADPWTLSSLSATGIDVIVGIPNDQLSALSQSYDTARRWVKENVTHYLRQGLKVSYVAVGNEPFLASYKGVFIDATFPALRNIQKALNEAGVGDRIKVVVPQNADVYDSSTKAPSGGAFRPDIRGVMTQIVRFLHSNGSPFVVNIYPFLSLHQNTHFPLGFAFFDAGAESHIADGERRYGNVFDANFDTLVFALKAVGAGDMEIVVGEVGWPTDGAESADPASAKRFYDGLLEKLESRKGTPMRPGPLQVYLFGLIDEDMKSTLPGNFERHWGLFAFDGKPKFQMDLSGRGKLMGAKGVEYLDSLWCVLNPEVKDLRQLPGNMDYSCASADCTPLAYGGSCNRLPDPTWNASYAFNAYFQTMDQDVRACDFEGLGVITKRNISTKECFFPIQIVSAAENLIPGLFLLSVAVIIIVVHTC